ncbi:conjugal transfer protein [Streptomyces sp. NPDC056191]|uniref:conjugal transfer protein n=1 Tax=Streptomyces sp. NPDC056191 TaxID=3345742 RepID=UPI0035D57262
MTTDHTPEQRKLTRGQIVAFTAATLPMTAVGVGGGIGTYANAKTQLGSGKTALGMLAAGEGATLIVAIVMIAVTMLGQAAPRTARAALWMFPIAASVMGLVIAPAFREAVIYALTPLAMTAAAEGASFVARRIVAYTSRTDTEAQRRNAELMRRIAFLQAQAQRHPDPKVRKQSELKAWKLMRKVGSGDSELGSGLIGVQRDRLTEGADAALQGMLAGSREPVLAAQCRPLVLEPSALAHEQHETAQHPGETIPSAVSLPARPATAPEPNDHVLVTTRTILHPADQPVSREPVLSPAEPPLTKAPRLNTTAPTTETREPQPEPAGESEPTADEKEQQITVLAQRLRAGEPLTKTTAAHLLGVSPATAGRRLKDARDRITDGTGMYL